MQEERNRNGTRNQLVEPPQATALLVVPDRSGWRCCLGLGKRLGEDRPLLGHIVFILGLVLIAVGHGWAINWADVRFAGHQRHRQRRA